MAHATEAVAAAEPASAKASPAAADVAHAAEAVAAAEPASTKASPAATTTTTTTTTTHARIGFDHEQRNDEEESRRDAKAGLERRCKQEF